MTRYCLESGTEGSGSVIIHKLDCASYDLGTLLGMGRIANLGEFESSLHALNSAKLSHPAAIRCLECCRADLVFLPKTSLGMRPCLNT
jgi:hypothetical protein